jgi:hypothetical protein
MSQSACSSSVAVDRAASSATGPQSRHLQAVLSPRVSAVACSSSTVMRSARSRSRSKAIIARQGFSVRKDRLFRAFTKIYNA